MITYATRSKQLYLKYIYHKYSKPHRLKAFLAKKRLEFYEATHDPFKGGEYNG